jgi:MFS family permease
MDMAAAVRRLWSPLYMVLYLPVGVASGFVSVTLGYELRQHGVSVADIAGIVSLSIVPWTWKVLGGPVLDLSLTPRTWAALCSVLNAAVILALGVVAATSAALPLIGFLSLMTGVGSVLLASSINNIIGIVEPEDERGPLGGYVQAGNLGGNGLGGGAGLWLAQHAGGMGMAGLDLAAFCLVCAAPFLLVRAPPRPRPDTLKVKTLALARHVWSMARSRAGALALLLNILPMGLGASSNLWSAVAGDWHASANVVALVTGVLGGLISIPGSLIGGLLCRYLPLRAVYLGGAVVCAALLAVMALVPHTQAAFVVLTLASAMALGTCWAALSSVSIACLGYEGVATKSGLLTSFSNLPLVVCIPIVGWAQSKFGSNAMLMTEVGIAAASVLLYLAVAYGTEPRPAAAREAAAA